MNSRVWAGFAVALVAVASYPLFFINYPVTRDFPWANLLLFVLAGFLLITGRRGWTRIVLGGISAVLCALFFFGIVSAMRMLPSGEAALRVGQKAPDFVLTDVENRAVSLAELRARKRAVLLIFYRGYW